MRWKWKFPHLIPCFHACHASEVFLNKHRYQWAARKGFHQGQGIRVQSSQAARLGKWEERDGHWERCPCSPTASWREARATLRSCHCPRVSLFQDIISFCYFQWKLMTYFQSINNWAFTNKEEKKELKPRISTSLCKFIWFSQKKHCPSLVLDPHYIDWSQCQGHWAHGETASLPTCAHLTPWKL